MTRWDSACATVERAFPDVLLTLGMAIVALILVGVAVAVINTDAAMHDAPRDMADVGLPDGRAMTPDDVHGLRFAMGLRGYRMGEVDEALARLHDELAERDAEIERLRQQRYAGAAVDAGPDDIVAIVDSSRDAPAAADESPDDVAGEPVALETPADQPDDVEEQLRWPHG